MLPGRSKEKLGHTWKRDLPADLAALTDQHKATTLVTMVTAHEIEVYIPPQCNYFEMVRAAGLHSVHYPLRDKWIPCNIASFVALIDDLVHRMQNSSPDAVLKTNPSDVETGSNATSAAAATTNARGVEHVIVHCNGGKGRSALVCACVVIVLEQPLHPTAAHAHGVITRIRRLCKGALKNPLQYMFCMRFVFFWRNRAASTAV